MKGVAIHYATYFVRSMLGFLNYAMYKESKKTDFLLALKQLIQNSLNLDNSWIKLRAATFFVTNLEYSQSIENCDIFLTFPLRHKVNSSHGEYIDIIWMNVFKQLHKGKMTEEIENSMKEILPMLYSSVELKSLPGNYDITQQNPAWTFVISQTYFSMIYARTWMLWRQKNGRFLIPSYMNYFHYDMIHILKNRHFLVSIWIQCLLAVKHNYYATIRWEM